MTPPLPGIDGNLFPSRFLADELSRLTVTPGVGAADLHWERQIAAWWRRVERTCGPASGLRTLFDLAIMPLAALLGFRAHDAAFEPGRMVARLTTRRGTAVGLLALPWSSRARQTWADVAVQARAMGADWCLLVGLPFVSIVDVRGNAVRRSVDFAFPHVLDGRSLPVFSALARSAAFDSGNLGGRVVTAIDLLVSTGAQFQEEVRRDLQAGVVQALGSIAPVLARTNGPDRALAPGADVRFSEALTIVYRILFLLFAESRDLVPRFHPAYGAAYSVRSLCREAIAAGDGPSGIWDGLAAITRLSRTGCDTSDLIVRPFNGRLFARSAAPTLERRQPGTAPSRVSKTRDEAVATALVALATRNGSGGRREITYADLGVEQLGAVYERVLDLNPREVAGEVVRAAHHRHSLQRRQTGTFYTPQPLAEFVVRRTLAPLVEHATPDEILGLRIVDPAMGSGAFLVAAGRYLALAYERALVNDGRCAETDIDDSERANIRRLLVTRCLAGVDANPVAVQLARLSLWLTTLARDKPLSFLDDRLHAGDSLVGTSPHELWRRGGRSTPSGGRTAPLLDLPGLDLALAEIAQPLKRLREGTDDSVADVRAREQLWSQLTSRTSPLEPWRLACDLWCSRWFWPNDDPLLAPSAAETATIIDAVVAHDRTLAPGRIAARLNAVRKIAHGRNFFHWPLEFPDIFFRPGGAPAGFDAVIGNPPWEVLRSDADSDADNANDRNDRRRTLTFLRESGAYPSCDRGHLNLYQPFLERSLSIVRQGGRVGLVLPWGLATDAGAASLRERLIARAGLASIVGFENSAGVFPIHRGVRFMVMVAAPGGPAQEIRARFGVRTLQAIDELPARDRPGDESAFPVKLTPETIRKTGGRSLRIPDARDPRDLDLLRRAADRYPRLGDNDGWSAEFGRELNATDDAGAFGVEGLPVIEGKHIEPFGVRLAGVTKRIRPEEAARRLRDLRFTAPRLAYRDVSGAGNRFALIAAMLPGGVVTTHTLYCLRNRLPIDQQHFLCGLFNSNTVNAMVRMLMGSHVTTDLVESLPVPIWRAAPEQRRVAELAASLAEHPDDDIATAELHAAVALMYADSGSGPQLAR